MFQIHRTIGNDNGDNVEANIAIKIFLPYVIISGTNQKFLFLSVNSINWASEFTRASFYLSKYDSVLQFCNNIDFLVQTPPILFKNCITF